MTLALRRSAAEMKRNARAAALLTHADRVEESAFGHPWYSVSSRR